MSPLIIAHRGDTKNAVENTLSAIESAIQLGVDGIEVDLQLTRDGHVVVFHDWDLKRLHGSSAIVQESTLAELKDISRGPHQIPTLEELLDLAGKRTFLNLELKTLFYFKSDLEKKVVEILLPLFAKEGAGGRSLQLSSFNTFALWHLKKLAPHLERAYLYQDNPLIHRALMPIVKASSVNIPLRYLSKNFCETFHKAGRKLFIWTVNDENDMKRCIEHNVDGIITDEPRRLLSLIRP
ncbi:MAG: hypothetical protein HY073_04035 [Deltaproteobacteria bacterium]|nr:hypothetical protein [Deltaproteobacteria bacterium]